jgi:hypothetical protein
MFVVIVMVLENHLLSCRIVIHRRASWEKALLLINMFLRVCKSLGMHDVCCFTFVWRRMVCVMELVEMTQLQKGLQDFNLNTLLGFWISSVGSSIFLMWIDHHFGKNPRNALFILGCFHLFRCDGDS